MTEIGKIGNVDILPYKQFLDLLWEAAFSYPEWGLAGPGDGEKGRCGGGHGVSL